MPTNSTKFPDYSNFKEHRKFRNLCKMIDMNNHYFEYKDRISTDCEGWRPTKTSLIAQHPNDQKDPTQLSHVEFRLLYNDNFDENGKVYFRYRAS